MYKVFCFSLLQGLDNREFTHGQIIDLLSQISKVLIIITIVEMPFEVANTSK